MRHEGEVITAVSAQTAGGSSRYFEDKTARVWDAASGKRIQVSRGSIKARLIRQVSLPTVGES